MVLLFFLVEPEPERRHVYFGRYYYRSWPCQESWSTCTMTVRSLVDTYKLRIRMSLREPGTGQAGACIVIPR